VSELGYVVLALIGVGLTAYLLFGGADFGAGMWYVAGRSAAQRRVIAHAMGPLWEANHVWLIFAMVLTWTAFPPVFAQVMSDHWVPLSLAALGIVGRGAGFAFGKARPDHRGYALLFGTASVLTPFCLGTVAGAVATGSTWLDRTSLYTGLLAVLVCAYLAAVYLTWDAVRLADISVAEVFRRYALTAGVAAGALAVPSAIVLGVRSPLIAVSALAGVLSLVMLARRAYVAVRVSTGLASGAVVWGGAQLVVSELDLAAVVALDPVLSTMLIVLAVGAVVVGPPLVWLYTLFQRDNGDHGTVSASHRGVEPGGGRGL
jgi:cytochrome bd ubiquinol oxidase subunit II